MSRSKVRTISAWLIQTVLALGFAAAALGKLAGDPHWIERFRAYGYSPRFLLLIGVLEAAGTVGLLIAPVAGYAAIGLFGIMIVATYTHAANHEASQLWATASLYGSARCRDLPPKTLASEAKDSIAELMQ